MGDNLVRKSDVIKVIAEYFNSRLDLCHTAVEAANISICAVELMHLIKYMKEVENG